MLVEIENAITLWLIIASQSKKYMLEPRRYTFYPRTFFLKKVHKVPEKPFETLYMEIYVIYIICM